MQRTLNGKFYYVGMKTLTVMKHFILTSLALDLLVFLDAKKSRSKGAADKKRRHKSS